MTLSSRAQLTKSLEDVSKKIEQVARLPYFVRVRSHGRGAFAKFFACAQFPDCTGGSRRARCVQRANTSFEPNEFHGDVILFFSISVLFFFFFTLVNRRSILKHYFSFSHIIIHRSRHIRIIKSRFYAKNRIFTRYNILSFSLIFNRYFNKDFSFDCLNGRNQSLLWAHLGFFFNTVCNVFSDICATIL